MLNAAFAAFNRDINPDMKKSDCFRLFLIAAAQSAIYRILKHSYLQILSVQQNLLVPSVYIR